MNNETIFAENFSLFVLSSGAFLKIERNLINLTKETTENVRMKCEFRGHPLPTIRWLKNEAPIEQEKGKIQIKQNILTAGRIRSRLIINQLDTHDTGYYKCEASNIAATLETIGVLIVRAGIVDVIELKKRVEFDIFASF
jgi:hypothetical protein